MDYFIYIGDNPYPIRGEEAAWSAYNAACVFADQIGISCFLVDGLTGEIITEDP